MNTRTVEIEYFGDFFRVPYINIKNRLLIEVPICVSLLVNEIVCEKKIR